MTTLTRSRPGAPHIPMTAAPLIATRVTKGFGAARALDGVSLDVRRGEIYAVVGANGAGKSTLLSIFAGSVRADSGTTVIFGHDAAGEASFVRPLITHVAADRLVGSTGSDAEHAPRGMLRRRAIAHAYLCAPALVLLDEPTTGLDIRSKRELQAFILDLRAGHDATIVVATHDLDEAERIADRIGVLDGGRLVAAGTADELCARYGASRLEDMFMAATAAR
ncbi:MAG TPA: ABC transporter ATP-binding protein [Candidatus Limnocylindrales bacterium]|nr:ABC transporter ATP-binding protein [Candidatus Limnocylindrales bacterium]